MQLIKTTLEPTGIGTDVVEYAYMFDGERVYKTKVEDGRMLQSAKEATPQSLKGKK
jgi:hypothetical protein